MSYHLKRYFWLVVHRLRRERHGPAVVLTSATGETEFQFCNRCGSWQFVVAGAALAYGHRWSSGVLDQLIALVGDANPVARDELVRLRAAVA